MVLDIILIIWCILMIIYGYKKGCVGIIINLVSIVVAFILSYILCETVGGYIKSTEYGIKIQTSIENSIENRIVAHDEIIISMLQEQLEKQELINNISNYIFIGIGFVMVFFASRIILWIAGKILDSIFELPVLRSFNKFGGIIVAIVIFIIEIGIVLAAIKSVTMFDFMNKTLEYIQSSVITKALYDHNIFTELILRKII